MAKSRKGIWTRKQQRNAKRRNSLRLEGLEDRLLLASDWQNPGNPLDVDDNPSTSFEVVPLDANIVITELNNRNFSSPTDGALPPIGPTDPAPENFLDVTGDMNVTPLDAVRVINQLNTDFSGASDVSFVAVDELAVGQAGDDALVNPTTGVTVNNPAVATGDDRTVIVWEQFDSANSSWAVFAQRFDAEGFQIGEAIQVSGGTELSQRHPAVAVNSIGAFAVTWQAESVDGDWDIHARSYTRGAVPIADTVQVNQTTDGGQVNPDIAFGDDGTFAVVWEGNGVGDHNGIFERELFLTGLSASDETLVNFSATDGRQSSPAVEGNSDGRFIVVWDGPAPDDATTNAVFASLDASPVVIERGDDVVDPALSVAADDSVTIAWRDGESIFAQEFQSDTTTGPELALDFSGLEPLGNTHDYEAWVIVDGAPVTAGIFDIDADGNPIDSAGGAAQFFSQRGATAVVISIEPENDPDPAPADTKILGGAIDSSGAFTLSIDHPAALNTDFSEASGNYILATPTTASTDDEFSGVWFIDTGGDAPAAGLDVPALPAGWIYEGWAVIDGVPVSTGRFETAAGADDFSGFSGPESAPPFPGEDFIQNAPETLTFPTNLVENAATIVVSVEPVPDNSPAPFTLKPLAHQVAAGTVDGVNVPLEPGNVAITGSGSVTQFLPAGQSGVLVSSGALSGPSLAQADDGRLMVAWVADTGNPLPDIVTRAFENLTAADATTANRTTSIGTTNPQVASVAGTFVTTWQGRGPNETSGIFARRTEAPLVPFTIAAIDDISISEGESSFVQTVSPVLINGDGAAPVYTLTADAPGASIDPDTGVISIPIDEATGPGDFNFIVTATEGTVSDSELFQLSVSEFNIGPELGDLVDQTTSVGNLFSVVIPAAADPDIPANTITYTATLDGGLGFPEWLNFDGATRTFFGSPGLGDVGVLDVVVTVSDGALNDTETFQINVELDDDAPSLGAIPNQTASVASEFSFQVPAATDVDTLDELLTYSATTEGGPALPAWLTFDSTTRTFSGTPAAEDAGVLDVLVTVSDGTLTDTEAFQINVELDDTAPAFGTIPNQSASVASQFSYQVPAAAVDDTTEQSLTYSATARGGLPLPGWLTFDSETRTFSGTPTEADQGNLFVVVSASDGATADFSEFQILVDTSERFELNAIPQVSVSLDDAPLTISRQATITDRDGSPDAPTYSIASNTLPDIAIDSATGAITLNIGSSDGPAFHLVTVTAMEGTFTVDEIFTVAVSP